MKKKPSPKKTRDMQVCTTAMFQHIRLKVQGFYIVWKGRQILLRGRQHLICKCVNAK